MKKALSSPPEMVDNHPRNFKHRNEDGIFGGGTGHPEVWKLNR